MLIQSRFDDLDLREEALRAEAAVPSDYSAGCTYVCTDTCTNLTNLDR